MPEEPEVETEKLHEAIHEELEREGGSLLKMIALTTAVLAALAAVAALEAGDTVNEALIKKTEATRKQAEASDQWAYYQAKGIKGAIHKSSEHIYLAAGKEPPAEFKLAQERYAKDQQEIKDKAGDEQKERDKLSEEADELLHKHHGFANTVALFQVAIALGAVAALTRIRLVWFGSMAIAVVGIVMMTMAFLA